MDAFVVVYFIIAFCVIFAALSAYLIYNHVQEEKEECYRNRLRRLKMQEGPSNLAKSKAEGEDKTRLLPPPKADAPTDAVNDNSNKNVVLLHHYHFCPHQFLYYHQLVRPRKFKNPPFQMSNKMVMLSVIQMVAQMICPWFLWRLVVQLSVVLL